MGVSCQNQDLRDYGIFGILQARLRLASAHPHLGWRDFVVCEKVELGEWQS